MNAQSTKFVKGAMILSIAGLIAKVFSAIYRIPLSYLVGNDVFGDYTAVYGFYGLLISPVLVGIPNALTKMVSERIAVNDYDNAHKIYRHAMVILGCLGFLISLFMILGVDWIIASTEWPSNNRYMIYGFSVSVMFIAIAGVYKSYFQGREIMVPTALTQIIENISKAIFGLSIIYLLIKLGQDSAIVIGGAAFGVSLAFILSTLYIVRYYMKHTKKIHTEESKIAKGYKEVTFGQVGKQLAKLAIPISLATAAYSVMNFIDTITIYKRMQAIGFNEEQVSNMYGYMGKALTIINVPLTISLALMISILPAISTAMVQKNKEEVRNKISLGIRLGLLLGLPAATGIIILANPIMTMIFRVKANDYLQLFGICLVLMIIGQTLAGILQGMGKYLYPAMALLVSVGIKYAINYHLIASDFQLRGAIIGSICYYVVFVSLNYWKLKKETGVILDKTSVFVKPILASVIMGISVFFIYKGTIGILHSNLIATVLTIISGMIIYFIVLFATKALQEDDLNFLPNHTKVIAKLKKLGLMKK